MRKADNLPLSRAVVTKFGYVNFLEPYEPLRACNGTDLPIQSGPEKCIHFLLINIFGININDISISG